MKKRNVIMASTLAGMLTLAVAPITAIGETSATVSKPASAMGSGNVAPDQPKSNQFWWP